jgi:hypothetical protein
MDACDVKVNGAGEKISSAAVITTPAMSTVPAHANAFTGCPALHAGPGRVHQADDFMARDTWILQARPESLLHHSIAMADAAGLHLDSHRAGAGLGDGAFDEFERTSGFGYLNCSHESTYKLEPHRPQGEQWF